MRPGSLISCIGFMRNSSHFAFVFCFEQDYNFKIESSFSKGKGIANHHKILGRCEHLGYGQ